MLNNICNTRCAGITYSKKAAQRHRQLLSRDTEYGPDQ